VAGHLLLFNALFRRCFDPLLLLLERKTPTRGTAPKTNGWNLQKGGWKAILSYWEGNFSGAMLSFERVGDVELKN